MWFNKFLRQIIIIIPLYAGRPIFDILQCSAVSWDVTVVSTLAARSPLLLGLPSPQQTSLPVVEAKYTSLTNSYVFQPIATESYGALSSIALSFLTTLGERLTSTSGNLREMSYLFQRLSGHCTAFQFGFSCKTRDLQNMDSVTKHKCSNNVERESKATTQKHRYQKLRDP